MAMNWVVFGWILFIPCLLTTLRLFWYIIVLGATFNKLIIWFFFLSLLGTAVGAGLIFGG